MSRGSSDNQYQEADTSVPSTPPRSTQSSQESSIAPSPVSINGEWKLVVQTITEIIWHRTFDTKDEWLTAAVLPSGTWDFTHTRDDDVTHGW